MTVHFHVGKIPVLISIGKTAALARELQEKDEVLLLTGLRFPKEGQLARYVLRKWAGGRR